MTTATSAIDPPNEPYWCLVPTESKDYKDWLEVADQIYATLVQEFLYFYRHDEERTYYYSRKFQQHLYENPNRQYILKRIADEVSMKPITLTLDMSSVKDIPAGMLHIESVIQSGHGAIEVSDDPESGLPKIKFTHDSIKKPL
ncbi:hypothetical protein [Acinetobacter thermotolerans]|uniref:hypothetical protein n=1 Tax=Acinetobacter thermotolerans TaxID=3151487 RepID=UPI00325BDDCC